MSDTNSKANRFTSYLTQADLEDAEAQVKNFKPKLLTGEIEVARAVNVELNTHKKNLKLTSQEDKVGLGILFITNFRLSFVTVDNSEVEGQPSYQQNTYLGKYDITLQNIDKIYQITDKKKKNVGPQIKNSTKIESIKIVCKNFRVVTYSFKKSEIGKGKNIADALAKFAFPARHNLLFLYHFNEKYYNASHCTTRMFNQKCDWSQELERCNATAGWRVLTLDRIDTNSLPMYYVVPRHLTDAEYFKLSRHFRSTRTAIWVWGNEHASLVRMGYLLQDITENTHENTMLEHVRRCDPLKRQPHLWDLTSSLPTIQDVYHSYLKLRELCAPESDRKFMEQDDRFYTLLDKSFWLLYVSLCLKSAATATEKLRASETVVLQENEGRDMCCIVSSLVQLLMDPYWRTIAGFQTLIQKEWVALGHPFSDRFGHILNLSGSAEQSPVFLLFLDCVWQLLQQFPEDFEFSETMLTTIWDSVFLPIFDTFQFNSEYDRQLATHNDRLVLRPVWDWGEQFTDKDIALFSNPMYKKPQATEQDIETFRRSRLPPSAFRLPGLDDLNKKKPDTMRRQSRIPQVMSTSLERFLEPKYEVQHLEIWTQCYFRWIPFLEIKGGGFPQIDLFNRQLLNNIHKLQKSLESGTNNELAKSSPSGTNEDVPADGISPVVTLPTINSFFPFSNYNSNAELIDMLLTSNDMIIEGSVMFDTASLAQVYD